MFEESVFVDLHIKNFDKLVEFHTEGTLSYCPPDDISKTLYKELMRREIAATMHDRTQHLLDSDASESKFQEYVTNLKLNLPFIADFFKYVKDESDILLKKIIARWINYTLLCFPYIENFELFKNQITSCLQSIFRYRQPQLRYPLTSLLAKTVDPKCEDRFFSKRFVEISASLVKPHTHVFRPLLCALTPDASSAEGMIGKYAPLLRKEAFKDASRQRNVVSGMLALIQSDHIDQPEKDRLLEVLTLEGRNLAYGGTDAKEFARAMQNLADFMPLTRKEKVKEEAILQLKNIESNADFTYTFGNLFRKILGRSQEKDEQALHDRKDSENFIVLTLFDEQADNKKKIHAIDQAVSCLDIKNPEERYEITNNLIDLSKLLIDQDRPRKNINGWKLSFDHAFEDDLLIGTDVIGSCQSIDGSPALNKALMGYVMQGKNRQIKIKSPDGSIQARCIVRLGIDETANKLVIHVEDTYQNHGIPGNINKVFANFLADLAQEMNDVKVVTHSSKYGKTIPCPNVIAFSADTAACKYVDSEGLKVVDSREGCVLSKGRQLVFGDR